MAALSSAGLPTDNFHFCGFLSSKSRQRGAQLEALLDLHGTLVFFESSHRIEALLEQLTRVFPHHSCVLAKELTKLHEQFLRGNAAQLLTRLRDDSALTKGEFVVLIDNAANPADERLNADDVDMWRRIAFAGYRFGYLDKVLHSYRKTPGGVTSRGVKRYPAILKSLKKQFELDLEPCEIQILRKRIYKVLLGYGIALCQKGDFTLSRKMFREALKIHRGLGVVRGLTKSYLFQFISGGKKLGKRPPPGQRTP